MAPSPTLDDEVTYVSGINPDGTLALNSFASWNDDNPATYTGGFTNAGKWFATASSNTAGTAGGTVKYYFDPASGWTANEKAAFVAAFNLWAAVANISFVETTDSLPSVGKITIKRGSDGQAHTQLAGSSPSGAGVTGGTAMPQITRATISIDTSVPAFGPIAGLNSTGFSDYGGYPLQVILHEIGHALGLGHGGPYPVSGAQLGPLQYSAYDSRLYTVMSYFNPSDTTGSYYSQYEVSGTNWGMASTDGGLWRRQAVTWMPVDILAIQRMYGAAAASPLSGNNIFGFNSNIAGPIAPYFDFNINTKPIVTLWSSGLNNTLDARNFSQDAVVNLNPGTFSSLAGLTNNIAIALGTRIDRLYTGLGGDAIVANNNGNYIDSGLGNDTITGGVGADILVGGLGNDMLDGGANVDIAVFSGPRIAYVISQAAIGNFTISGPDGVDTLVAAEFAQFDDQKFRLLPGEGVIVNFNADPAGYMADIRDFDGNNFIGQGTLVIDSQSGKLVGGPAWDGISGWSLAGSADVNGSNTQSHILFNHLIGRWAEVTAQQDGKVYFHNYGWAGDTRIVGIYVDPLVQSGAVTAGSDTDSQRRFQNDLYIGNLKNVAAFGDFDHDGFQEVYFSLTDGTAYLHAYMHADGNIRYANYQSRSQVQDYLAANGYSSANWGSWLSAAQEAPILWTEGLDPSPEAFPVDNRDGQDLSLPVTGQWLDDTVPMVSDPLPSNALLQLDTGPLASAGF